MTENLNDVVQAMEDAKPARTRKPSAKKDTEPAVVDTSVNETVAETVETVDEVVEDTSDNITSEPKVTEELPRENLFPGCNTCRNFGSYPAWQPCCDCRNNPKNSQSFYQA
jgi:hypothetical protein